MAGTEQASSAEVFLLPCLQFVDTIRSFLPASSNVMVAITRITASSVSVESSVTFLDGDSSAASSFASALSANPNSVFPASTYGAVAVTGTVSTQSVVGETFGQPSCITCTCLSEFSLPRSEIRTRRMTPMHLLSDLISRCECSTSLAPVLTMANLSAAANAPAPAPSSASTSSIAMLALTGAVGAFCLAVVSL